MISAVKGTVFDISPGVVQLDTGNGFVVKIFFPVADYAILQREKNVILHTVQKIKDEDIILYGFQTKIEKRFFEKLISVSGVGGKTALSMISAFSAQELINAVNDGDVSKISSIPGIGKKTAGRVILELTGKLELDDEQIGEAVGLREDLVSGLVNLGYPAKGVKDHVSKVMKENPELHTFEELFKLILKKIAKA